MRRGIVIWGLGLASFVASPAASASSVAATCAHQSGASFHPPRAQDMSFGPLRFTGLRLARKTTAQDLRESGGSWKSPVLLGPGHIVTVSIDPSARSFARLDYTHGRDGAWESMPHAVRFASCSAKKAQSEVVPGNWSGGSAPANLPGKPVTFWSGGFLFKKPGCVPLTIRIDRKPVRHWRLSVGVECPRT